MDIVLFSAHNLAGHPYAMDHFCKQAPRFEVRLRNRI